MPKGVSRYYFNVQPKERTDQGLPVVQEKLDEAGIDPSGLTIPQQVSLARAIYNNVYYDNLPEWSAMTVDDTTPYALHVGHFERTNLELRRADDRITLTSNVISELFRTYLERRIRQAIQNELYKDNKLMHYLPLGVASSRIDVEVGYIKDTAYGHLELSVSGPFWLRFFFSGRRAFTIHGNPANQQSHGMLVFYDPQTGQKIVTKEVHMPAIPKGLYVEKAMRQVLNEVLDSERFLRAFNKVFHPNQKSSPNYGMFYDIGRWDTFQEILVRQMRTVRDVDDFAVYDILKDIGRGRVVNANKVSEVRSRFSSEGHQAAQAFDSALREYAQVENQEDRLAKSAVYNALRKLLMDTKTTLKLSDVKAMLPPHLAARSTAGGIYRRIVPRL